MKSFFAIITFFIISFLIWPNSPKKHEPSQKNYNYKSFAQYPLSAGLPQTLLEVNRGLKSSTNSNFFYLIIHHPKDFFYPYSLHTVKHLLGQKQEAEFDAGHVQLAWSCKYKRKLLESATGFTGDRENLSLRLAREGYGFSPLVATYLDGYLEGPRIIDEQILKSRKKGHLTIIAFEAGAECGKVLENIWAFVNDENNNLFSLAQLPGSKYRGYNCISLLIHWLRPIISAHQLLESKSKETFKLSSKLFKSIQRSDKVTNVIFPQLPHSNKNKITLTTIFESKDDMREILVTLYSPATLLRNLKRENFKKKKLVYEGRPDVYLL